VAVGNWHWVAVAIGSGSGNWQLAIGSGGQKEPKMSEIGALLINLQPLCVKSGCGCGSGWVAVCSKVAVAAWQFAQKWHIVDTQCGSGCNVWQWLQCGSGCYLAVAM
jgi:hypothetical protein